MIAFNRLLTNLEGDGDAGFFVDELWQSDNPFAARISEALYGGSWKRPVRVTWVEVRRPPSAAPPPLLALAFFASDQPGQGLPRRLIGLHLLYRQSLRLR